MFKARLLSGIVLVVLAVVILYLGGYYTAIATLLLSLGGVYELLRVFKIHKSLQGMFVYLTTIVYYALLCFGYKQFIIPLLLVLLLAVLTIYVMAYPKYNDKEAMAPIFAFIYVSVMLSYVYQIRELNHGGALVVMIFICSWVNDTCAYCVGVKFGKHKMSPKLSPKKSIEGLIGGIVGAAIFAAVYGIFFNKNVYELNNAPLIFAFVGAIGACIAVVGDLTASAIKRHNDIKDYGKLIPGHGGVLDRFDSIIFTAPVIYYGFFYLIGNLGG